MFIDQGDKKQEQESPKPSMGGSFFDSNRNIFILGGGLFLVFVVSIGLMIYLVKTEKKPIEITQKPVATTTEEAKKATSTPYVGLPGDFTIESGEDGVTILDGVQGERLAFGNYYKQITDDATYEYPDYELPINIKTDVANYYDISRKMNLDASIDSLNENGFVIIDNPFSSEANDFYSVYDLLSEKQIPAFVTTDFILYYQQNIFKKVFKEIEANVFYDNLWSINYKMYKISKARYERILSETGVTNDPVLEGARTELVYFAVALKLLEPKEDQISEQTALTDGNSFTPTEAYKFTVNFPTYLEGQVAKEYNLIKEASTIAKSPALLYERNYKDFIVPEEYKGKARLNNFYLASRWASSLFPLYYKGPLCSDCLLDKDDWRVNMITASLITKDLADNQDIKNQWAVIYKILSFFTGLRGDLNYLYYEEEIKKLFGEDMDVETIFSLVNEDREENFSKLQKALLNIDFLEIEGARDRNNSSDYSKIGLRLLSNSYWPDRYIFKKLNNPNSGDYIGAVDRVQVRTICKDSNQRCRGLGLDIVNLVSPVLDNEYFDINTNYLNYKKQVSFLKSQLNEFTIYNWHNNNFWVNLDVSKTYLNYDESKMPVFMQDELWRDKEINTALGAWVNLQLPIDKFSYYTKRSERLGDYARYNEYNYIEPNLKLVQELRANTIMLRDMLAALGVSGDTNSVLIDLQELEDRLLGIESIIIKELNGQEFEGNDQKTIESFIKQFEVSKQGAKELLINFDVPEPNHSIIEDINGVKLAIVIYQKEEQKVFAVGPVFNYQER